MYSYEQIEEKLKGNQIIYVEKQDDKVDYQAEKYNFVYREINYEKDKLQERKQEIMELRKQTLGKEEQENLLNELNEIIYKLAKIK